MNSDDSKYRPAEGLDAELQRELDDALGGQSVFSYLDAEEAAARKKSSGGPVRQGRVIAIQRDDIFVDMGGKSQGVLSAEQYRDDPLPNVGDTVDVIIERYDGAEGLLILSREGAVKIAAWDTLAEGQVVEGRVTGHNKGGLELDINGIAAFMPISQVEMFRVEDLGPYMNQRLKCEVVEVDRAAEKVVVSRRNVLEIESAERREQLFESLAEGKVLMGKVRSIMPYGAFVDIGGIDGLLHIRDMSHKRIEKCEDVVHEGQQLEVMVLKVDKDTRKISLGLKQVMPDPWADAETKWPVGTVVTGRISKLMDFGAFTELEEGVEGLVPVGEITFQKRLNHPREVLSEGQVVQVRVLSVDVAARRIGLSIKQVGDDPWIGSSVRWPENTLVEGMVTRITDFGAFVEVAPGVEGLVHISELSDKRVKSVKDAVQIGQTIKAKVVSVDEEARRMSLSIKQAAAMTAMQAAEAAAAATPPPPAKKRKKPLKGGFD